MFSQPDQATQRVGLDVRLVDVDGKAVTRHRTLCVRAGGYTDAKLPKPRPVAVGPLPSNPPEGGERLAGRRVVAVSVTPTGDPC